MFSHSTDDRRKWTIQLAQRAAFSALGYLAIYSFIQFLLHPISFSSFSDSNRTGKHPVSLDQNLAKLAQQDVKSSLGIDTPVALLNCKESLGLPGPLDDRQRLFIYTLVECSRVIQFQASPSSRDLYEVPNLNTLQSELDKTGKIHGNCFDIATLTNATLLENGFQSELRYQPNHIYLHILDYNIDYNKQNETQVGYERLDWATLSVIPLWASASKVFFALILLVPFHDKRPLFYTKAALTIPIVVWVFFAPHQVPMLMLDCSILYLLCISQLVPERLPRSPFRFNRLGYWLSTAKS